MQGQGEEGDTGTEVAPLVGAVPGCVRSALCARDQRCHARGAGTRAGLLKGEGGSLRVPGAPLEVDGGVGVGETCVRETAAPSAVCADHGLHLWQIMQVFTALHT